MLNLKHCLRLSAVLICAMVWSGCDRSPKPAQPKAQQQLAAGRVSVSADRELTQWIPPPVSVTAENIDQLLEQAQSASKTDHWFSDEHAVLPIVLAVAANSRLATPEQLKQAESMRQRAVHALLAFGTRQIPNIESSPMALAQTTTIAAVLRVAAPGDTTTFDYLDTVELAINVANLNAQGQALIDNKDYGDAPDQGAQAVFRQVLTLSPDNATAHLALANIEQLLIIRAMNDADSHWYNLATVALRRAAQVRNDSDGNVGRARNDLERHREDYLHRLRDAAIQTLPQHNGLKQARANLVEMIRVSRPGNRAVAELSTRIDLYQHYGPYRPGQTFADALSTGLTGPTMVVVPHGAFVMGAGDDDPLGQKNERPAHNIRFARGFALGQHEITVREFGRFIAATGHKTRATRRGFSTIYSERTGNFARQSFVDWYSDFHGNKAAMNAPVIHISARDAQAYVEWLSAASGKNYRLPSETEFEYALRAGTQTPFPWGKGSPPSPSENLTGLLDVSVSGRHWQNGFAGYRDGYWGPAPVASLQPNRFGLFDMGGNLSEWTADCIHASFRRAPSDGKAWINPGCRSYVTKGGSWASSPEQSRSAFRMGIDADTTNSKLGFRVARDL